MPEHFCSRLPFFGLIQVGGADRAAFLHNQLSNDILQLSTGQACLATYNTAKGRVVANLLVLNRGDDLLLVTAADLVETLIKRLRLYVLRSKVTLNALPDWAVAGCGDASIPPAQIPATPQWRLPAQHLHPVWQITLSGTHTLRLGAATDLPAYHPENALRWQSQQIQSGHPWIEAATSETCVAQMLNQHLLGAVHFKKGCYPGQEVIARAQYRGQVKRGLVLLSAQGTLHEGETVYDEHQEAVGLIINQAPQNHDSTLALAVIKHAAAHTALHTANQLTLMNQFCFFNPPEGAA